MAEDSSDSDTGKTGLQLPAAVTIARSSAAGPFARGTLEIGHATLPLTNGSAAAVKIAQVFVSPLTETRSGLAAPAARAHLSAKADRAVLDPGETAVIDLTGSVPAQPGTYRAQLYVITEAGDAAVAPVSVSIAAHAGWGIACMALGLALLGVLKLLTGEGDVQNKEREVLRTRAEIHAALQRDPPPERQAAAVSEIDRDLDEAIRALAQPRPFSVVDRRIRDAEEDLSAARDRFAKLQAVSAGLPSGAAEVAELSEDWSGLQHRMRALAKLDDAAAQPAAGMAAHADALLHRAWQQLIGLPLQWVAADLEPQLERVHLANDAGEIDRARVMAVTTRAWLRRAADDLDRRLALMMGLHLSAGQMVVSDAWVRRLAAGGELPPEQSRALLDRLTAADAGLAAGTTLEDLLIAARLVEDTLTQADRDLASALKIRVQAAADAAAAEMSVDAMNAIMSELGKLPHPTTEQKTATLSRMLAVWRGKLGVVQDATARAGMAAAMDTAEAAANRRDLAATMRAVHDLERQWQIYLPRHVAAAGAAAVGPVCREWRQRNLQFLAETSAYVKLQSGRPEVADWERRLDRARRGLLAVVPEAAVSSDDCLGPVVGNGREILAVSQEVFTRALGDVPIPPKMRLDAAQNSGVAAAIALSQRLMVEPRDLKLTARTPVEDRIVDQPIYFSLAGLDPDWGSGVGIVIDWGDGTAPLQSDAEQLRQGYPLEHSFHEVRTVHAVAIAADRFLPAAHGAVPRPNGPILGESTAQLLVGPAPATAAGQLADIFLTGEFGLALLIASVVYFWRYHSGDRVLGARSFDYAEVFAVGFAAYAAVSDLPRMLGALPFK